MSKALFRYMRGELNGFYLQNIQNLMNVFSKDVKDFFYEFKRQQFERGEISTETLNNIGKFAGIYLLRLTRAEALSAVKMTESFVKDGIEYSERSLFELSDESFNFSVGINLPEGADINNYASDEQRSSLVGDETPLGYIDYTATDVLDDNGNVRPEAILSEPPESGAYSEYYGNKFMFLSEGDTTFGDLSADLMVDLFKAMQWVRYNGISITAVCKIIDSLCPNGFVKIDSIVPAAVRGRFYLYYTYNDDVELDMKLQRFYLLQYVIRLKFVQIELIES